jgi:GNAT superfamily N-acetyltransferase
MLAGDKNPGCERLCLPGRGVGSAFSATRRQGQGLMSEIQIRALLRADVAPVSELIQLTLGISNAADYPTDELAAMQRSFSVAAVGNNVRGREAVVATRDGMIVGVATRGNDARRQRVSRALCVFVHPAQQRRGLGRRLLGGVEAGARAAGHSVVRLGATRTALPFYRRLGYVPLQSTQGPADRYVQMGKNVDAMIRREHPATARPFATASAMHSRRRKRRRIGRPSPPGVATSYLPCGHGGR